MELLINTHTVPSYVMCSSYYTPCTNVCILFVCIVPNLSDYLLISPSIPSSFFMSVLFVCVPVLKGGVDSTHRLIIYGRSGDS